MEGGVVVSHIVSLPSITIDINFVFLGVTKVLHVKNTCSPSPSLLSLFLLFCFSFGGS